MHFGSSLQPLPAHAFVLSRNPAIFPARPHLQALGMSIAQPRQGLRDVDRQRFRLQDRMRHRLHSEFRQSVVHCWRLIPSLAQRTMTLPPAHRRSQIRQLGHALRVTPITSAPMQQVTHQVWTVCRTQAGSFNGSYSCLADSCFTARVPPASIFPLARESVPYEVACASTGSILAAVKGIEGTPIASSSTCHHRCQFGSAEVYCGNSVR